MAMHIVIFSCNIDTHYRPTHPKLSDMTKGKIFPDFLISRIFLTRESRENKKVMKISGFTVFCQGAYFAP